MSGRDFVDTNVLIHAHDSDAGTKYAVASAKIEELWASHLGVLSTQVLQEFYVNITAKIPKPVPKSEACTYVGQQAKTFYHANRLAAFEESVDTCPLQFSASA